MRLSETDARCIKSTISSFTRHAHANSGAASSAPTLIYLYGSRTRDDLLGGDIDLAIVVSNTAEASRLSQEKHTILARIKASIDDQRIDLSIITLDQARSDAFWTLALRDAIEL